MAAMRACLILACLFPAVGWSQAYFQQEVNYTIEVALNDETHYLTGQESFEYINNSPDTLHFIWLHLWPNAYKNSNTALGQQLLRDGSKRFYNSLEEHRGWIEELDFKVDGAPVQWEAHPEHIDICKLPLPKPLAPGAKTVVSTPFAVKLPKGIYSRMGHIKQQYQITQWYVKPAVYDRKGWHEMPYLSQGEFYSEFGSFDVSITVPKNYVVGATGDLQTESEIEYLNDLAAATAKLDSFPEDTDFPPSHPETKTLRYTQQQVHDFAWFADKRYHVLKGSVELPNSGRNVTTWCMFTNHDGASWENSIEYVNDALFYYSKWNGDYPYNHMTAVDGALSAGAGMEYPNITVVAAQGDTSSLEVVIMHEVGHNWFYGMLASNERAHPWMDEGLNSMNEYRYMHTKYPHKPLVPQKRVRKLLDLDGLDHSDQGYLLYLAAARSNLDQPIEFPAEDYSQINYGGIVYGKTALVFRYLMAYLGEETYDKVMKTYFERWKFKHPQPEDFRAVVEEVSGKQLDWLFDDLILTTKTIDYRIVSNKVGVKAGTDVRLKNTGEVASPVSVGAVKDGKVVEEVWLDGFEGEQSVRLSTTEYDYITIDPGRIIPEINRHNNISRQRGIFRKTEPLKLKFAGGLENPKRNSVYWSPIAGWNRYDGFMAGMLLYNSLFPQRKFDWTLMPMYGFESQSLAGLGSFNYRMFPGDAVRQITFGADAQKFALSRAGSTGREYFKVAPRLRFDFGKKSAQSSVSNMVLLTNHQVFEYIENTTEGATDWYDYSSFTDFRHVLNNKRTLNPWSVNTLMRYGDVQFFESNRHQFLALSVDARYHLDIDRKGTDLDVRFFGGKYFFNETGHPRYNWQMDGTAGWNDYTYEHLFFGRGQIRNVLANQFELAQGGFKVPTAAGQSNDWIVAMNLELDLPIGLPLAVFADLGYNAGPFGEPIYSAGLTVPFSHQRVQVYFPLLNSENIIEFHEVNGFTYLQTVRFNFNIRSLDPKRQLNSLLE